MKLKLNTNQQVLPPGGHQFHSHSITFTADSFTALSRKVYDFRVNNMMPAGNPDAEILQYYLEKWPNMVELDDSESVEFSDLHFDVWARWLGRIWRNPPRSIVAIKEAEMRYETCKTCPKNTPFTWKETPETLALNQRAFLLRRGYERPKIGRAHV